MYKLVAIDLDGTLLNSNGEVSKENRDAISLAIKNNVEIVACSGRITNSVKNIAIDIGANNYLISGNGAELYDIKNEKTLYENYINKNLVLKLIKFCETNSIYYSIFSENSIIVKSLNYNVLVYNSENLRKEPDKRTNINVTPNIYEYIEKGSINRFSKITICDNNKMIFNGILNKLRKIKGIDVLDVAHMSNKTVKLEEKEYNIQYYYTEITAQNVNKWNAILKLAKILNVKNEEIMCIGDNVNDKEMLENAGKGIAMGNSAPYIKNIADEVVKSNNESGVAEAITRYCI